MHRFFTTLIDIILPRKERVVRSSSYTIDDLGLSPNEHSVGAHQITTLMSYRTTAVENSIRALKYDKSERVAQLFADALAEYLREEIASHKLFSSQRVVLVPIPLHRIRERERGFNQISVILKKLPLEFRNGTLARVSNALIRTRHTKQQTKLSREERLTNVAGAFTLALPETVQCAHIILIDDVTTTGATLIAATQPFKEHGIAPDLIALAHA